MVIKAIMKLFGGSRSDESANAGAKSGSKKAESSTSLKELEGFVDYVVKALVDFPDEVKVSSEMKSDGKVIKINCRESDRGKIIGKKGKTIIALRSLVAGAAGRMQDRVTVEVIDDEVKD